MSEKLYRIKPLVWRRTFNVETRVEYRAEDLVVSKTRPYANPDDMEDFTLGPWTEWVVEREQDERNGDWEIGRFKLLGPAKAAAEADWICRLLQHLEAAQ